MEPLESCLLLRVFLDEADRRSHQPLYEVLVTRAREMGLAGATVLRSPLSFGSNKELHTAKILDLSAPLSLVIEFVDSEEKIRAYLPVLEELMNGGMATLEKVQVIHYRPRGA